MPDNSTPETGERTPVIVIMLAGEWYVNVAALREQIREAGQWSMNYATDDLGMITDWLAELGLQDTGNGETESRG